MCCSPTLALRASADRSMQLEVRNNATYAALAKNQTIVDRTERQVREILDEFHRVRPAFVEHRGGG